MVDLVAEEFSYLIGMFTSGITVFMAMLIIMSDFESHLKLYTVIASLLFTIVASSIINTLITSTVISTSVCFSMDPNLFSRRSPELYYRFKDRYAGFLNV